VRPYTGDVDAALALLETVEPDLAAGRNLGYLGLEMAERD
jgi:hypothetical protein